MFFFTLSLGSGGNSLASVGLYIPHEFKWNITANKKVIFTINLAKIINLWYFYIINLKNIVFLA